MTGIIVSPESPAAGELATITLTGNDNPCGGAIVWYGDGEFEAYLESDGLPLSAGTTTGTHRWTEGGVKTLVAEAQGHRCRGRVTHDITVKGPSATLTAPSAGATFYTPASIALAATASDTSGQPITRVDFYANGALLGSDATAPYGFTWSGAPIGTHVLVAKAVNALGIVGGSVPVTIEIEPPPFIITVNPASPSATLAAQVTVGAMPGCATVSLDFGDGGEDTFLGQAGQPLTGSYAWSSAGTFTIQRGRAWR